MLAAGTQLGRYEIAAPLGAGGMGEVYRATDSRLDRQVAIKVLPPQFVQDQARLARFEREAKVVAALSHPNILGIHDFGTEQGQTFAVMELLEGETLRRRIDGGALPWRTAVEITLAIAEGLTAAHAKGIIHRDLKPENIFLTSDERVKILDFGLARIEPSAATSGDSPTGTFHPAQTEAGVILGTVGYMAPEQVRGRDVEARSDIFSLGCVLYEMVTGKRAFATGSAAETMAAILHEQPQDLANSGHQVPAELKRVVQQCLEKERDQRFPAARDLASALRAMLSESEIVSRHAAPRATWQTIALGFLVATVLLGVVATVFLPGLWPNNDAKHGQVRDSELPLESVAVLPFAYQSGDQDAEILAEGIPQSVSASLAQIRTLKVRPQTSVSHVKEQAADDPFAAGKALQAQALVTGKIQKLGERLIVTWQLADVRSNQVLDGASYNRAVADIFQLQEEFARDIASKLRLKLSGEDERRLTRRYTENTQSYQLYLKGRYFWNKRTRQGLERSIDCFQQAIDLDPNYALAWAGLADAYQVYSVNVEAPPKDSFPKAKAAALAALQIDDTLAEARANLAAIATFYEWDWPRAEKEFQRSIELDPNYAPAHQWFGEYLSRMGRFQEAKEQLERARELEPLSLIVNSVAGKMSYYARHYDAAISQYHRVLDIDPDFWVAHLFLAQAYAQQGQFEEAVAELQRFGSTLGPHPLIGYVYARMGKVAEAQALLDELQSVSRQRYVTPYYVAIVCTGLGKRDDAFAWLEKAIEDRNFGIGTLKVEPMLDGLRGDPRFDSLLRRLGLAEKSAPTKSVAEGSAQPLDTLAVLPFDNQSSNPETGYLGDDITYSLTDSLARIRELKVRPYSSAARFKGGSSDVKAAGSQLQVQAVLHGSIQLRGDEVLIVVELTDVSENRRLWGNRYPGKLADRLTVQQQIIQEVPDRLFLSLTGQDRQTLAKLPTKNLKAHELYTLGRLAWNRRRSTELQKAITHFDEAIRLDPNYALAHAGRADCYALLPNYSRDFSSQLAMSRAKDAAQKALALDSTLAEAHCALAWVQGLYEWDFPAAERRFQLALERKPNYPTGRHWFGVFLSNLGRHDEAISQIQQARDLDAESLIIRSALGEALYFARRFDEAEAQVRATLAQSPDFNHAALVLGANCLAQNRYPEAITVLREAWERDKSYTRAGALLGYAYGVSGADDRAREVLLELRHFSEQGYVSPMWLAIVHLGLGANEDALKLLEQGLQDKTLLMTHVKSNPIFDGLRSDPRFQKIIADMKFPP